MTHNHELENQDLRPTTSDQVEKVHREKEEEKELENEELKAVAGGAAPPEAYLPTEPYCTNPNGCDDPNGEYPIKLEEPAPPPPDDPISDLEELAQTLLPGG